jgi:hypothetical protein
MNVAKRFQIGEAQQVVTFFIIVGAQEVALETINEGATTTINEVAIKAW